MESNVYAPLNFNEILLREIFLHILDLLYILELLTNESSVILSPLRYEEFPLLETVQKLLSCYPGNSIFVVVH